MKFFKFQKSYLERLDECLSVLSWKNENISASRVKTEWCYFIELRIEPSGWQALWKIPRNICEKLKIRYPCIVLGFVEHVNFKDLNAIYNITCVQEENVHLPERHEVGLEDLWPTDIQENVELNIEQTADCLDRLRFFYSNIWMPWDNDNDDDFNWVEKHLQSRIKLYFDLQQRNISRPIASFLHSLIAEAKYIQQKREYIEEDIFDDEGDNFLTKPRLTQLMLMNLRMTVIRSHIEMIENPDMRSIYEEVKFNTSKNIALGEKNTEPSYHVVILPSSISRQIELLQNAERNIPKNSSISLNHSLQDVLDTCKPGDKIFLSAGCHVVNFMEYFFTSGQLAGVEYKNQSKNIDVENCVRLNSQVSNNALLMFDGDFILDNIELDCRNVLTGIIVKHGILTIRNCKLIGNGKSSIQHGLVCHAHTYIHMDNCIVENFATGILLNENSSLALKDSFIFNCNIGVEMSELANIKCSKSNFNNCSFCGIYLSGLLLNDVDDNKVMLKDFEELKKHSPKNLQFDTDCYFENCNSVVCIINDKKSLVSRKTLSYIENHF